MRFQRRLAVPNVHAHPIHQMIAMRFHDQLTPLSRNLAQQAAQRSLSARVKVYFRLLQQTNRWRVVAKQLSNDGQGLADAVTDIYKVSRWTLDLSSSFYNMYLKRSPVVLAERFYTYIVEQA